MMMIMLLVLTHVAWTRSGQTFPDLYVHDYRVVITEIIHPAPGVGRYPGYERVYRLKLHHAHVTVDGRETVSGQEIVQ